MALVTDQTSKLYKGLLSDDKHICKTLIFTHVQDIADISTE